MGRELTYAEALVEGLRAALQADENVHLMGQYFLGITPHRHLIAALHREYPERVWYPPIAEMGYIGCGIGAAMVGLRPIVDVATASFIFQGWAQIANEAANIHYMSGGQTRVPAVFHINHGIRGGGAAQHSHSPQAMLWNTPGLEIVLPASPHDVKGLIGTAVASPNPTIWIDHVGLFDQRGEVPDGSYTVPFGEAALRRAGDDVTIVATSLMVSRSLDAAERVADDGVEAEVLDLRTLVPLDDQAILESVARTGRLVVVDECHRRCGVAAEITALVAERAFGSLRAPIARVVTEDVPIPFSRPLEERVAPTVEKIVAAVHNLTGLGPAAAATASARLE